MQNLLPFLDNHEWLESAASSTVSSPAFPSTPYIDVDLDDTVDAFSHSFSGFIDAYTYASEPFEHDDSRKLLGVDAYGEHARSSSDSRGSMHWNERNTEGDHCQELPKIDEAVVVLTKTSFAASDEIKSNIGNFEVLAWLGEGGAATVHLARNRSDRALYAIKQTVIENHSALTQLRIEASILNIVATLRSPFLSHLHGNAEDDKSIYLILKYYPGGDLLTQLTRTGRFDLERTRFYASELIQGLSALHSAGIIHRDIKPENVMIDVNGHVVLTDFGCAKLLPAVDVGHRQRSFTSCGTPEYQAPEIILGWAHDYLVDIWGFGMLLHLMLFGTHPFITSPTLEDTAELQNRIVLAPSLRPIDCSVSKDAQNLISLCLEPNPSQRAGLLDIKAHAFFLKLDWDYVSLRAYPAPWKPQLDPDLVDLRYFDRVISQPILIGNSKQELGVAHNTALDINQQMDDFYGVAASEHDMWLQRSNSLPNIIVRAATLPLHSKTTFEPQAGSWRLRTTGADAAANGLFASGTRAHQATTKDTPNDTQRQSREPTSHMTSERIGYTHKPFLLPLKRRAHFKSAISSRLSLFRKLKHKHRKSIAAQHRNTPLTLPLHIKAKGKGFAFAFSRSKQSFPRRAWTAFRALLPPHAQQTTDQLHFNRLTVEPSILLDVPKNSQEENELETILREMEEAEKKQGDGSSSSHLNQPSLSQSKSQPRRLPSTDSAFAGAVDRAFNPVTSSVQLMIVSS